jgi:hypothetical protein
MGRFAAAKLRVLIVTVVSSRGVALPLTMERPLL